MAQPQATCVGRAGLQPYVCRLQPYVFRLQPHVSRLQPYVFRLQPHVSRLQPYGRLDLCDEECHFRLR